jgi:hypothetical protein
MYGHSLTMVTASSHGGPRSIFGGVYAPGGYNEIPLLAAWMAALSMDFPSANLGVLQFLILICNSPSFFLLPLEPCELWLCASCYAEARCIDT